MSLRSPLSQARGLGSAKSGTMHWWAQRWTALALVPLLLWFVVGLIGHIGADYGEAAMWVGHPVRAVLMIILIAAVFYHGQLGMQVAIEDYIHTEWLKFTLLFAIKGSVILLSVASIFAVLRIAFGVVS